MSFTNLHLHSLPNVNLTHAISNSNNTAPDLQRMSFENNPLLPRIPLGLLQAENIIYVARDQAQSLLLPNQAIAVPMRNTTKEVHIPSLPVFRRSKSELHTLSMEHINGSAVGERGSCETAALIPSFAVREGRCENDAHVCGCELWGEEVSFGGA